MIGAFPDVLQKLADGSALLDISFDVSEDADIGHINYQLLKLILPFLRHSENDVKGTPL